MKIMPFHTSTAMYKAITEVRRFEAAHRQKAYVLLTNVKPEDEGVIASRYCVPVFDFVLSAGNPEVMIETCRVLKYAGLTAPQYKLFLQRRGSHELVCTMDMADMPSAFMNELVTGFK